MPFATTAVLNHPLDTSSAEADLLAMAHRLDLGPAIITGGEIDMAALARLQAAERAPQPAYPHNTPMERLWIEYDPEYPEYAAALADLRASSRQAPEFFIVLLREPDFIKPMLVFSSHPYIKFADAYKVFRSTWAAIAIARAGVVIACKK